MKFISSIQDGTAVHVVAVDQDGVIHVDTHWAGRDGTVRCNELVFTDHAAGELVTALRSALAVV